MASLAQPYLELRGVLDDLVALVIEMNRRMIRIAFLMVSLLVLTAWIHGSNGIGNLIAAPANGNLLTNPANGNLLIR